MANNKKMYVEGLGYIEVEITTLRDLPNVNYFCSDADYNFYITAYDDTVYAVPLEGAWHVVQWGEVIFSGTRAECEEYAGGSYADDIELYPETARVHW